MLGLRFTRFIQRYLDHTLQTHSIPSHSPYIHGLHSHFHRHFIILSTPSIHQKRSASLFGWLRQIRPNVYTPSPQTIAEITRLENIADAEPNNVQSHVELFDHLVRTGTKSGLSIVMNRWERMCEFVSLQLL